MKKVKLYDDKIREIDNGNLNRILNAKRVAANVSKKTTNQKRGDGGGAVYSERTKIARRMWRRMMREKQEKREDCWR